MMALSGVRSSWDMFARNSDLCLLATSSSRLFSSTSWNRRAFSMARTDWLANVWSRSTTDCGNSPGASAADHQRADDALLADQRHGQERAEAGLRERVQRTGLGDTSAVANVWDLDRRPEVRGPPDDGALVEARAARAGSPRDSSRHLVGGAQDELAGRLVKLVDGAAVGARQLDGVRRRWWSALPGDRATSETVWLTSPSAC